MEPRMIRLIFYSRKHGIKAMARCMPNLILNKRQVTRLEEELREPLDACRCIDTEGKRYEVDYRSMLGAIKLSKEEP